MWKWNVKSNCCPKLEINSRKATVCFGNKKTALLLPEFVNWGHIVFGSNQKYAPRELNGDKNHGNHSWETCKGLTGWTWQLDCKTLIIGCSQDIFLRDFWAGIKSQKFVYFQLMVFLKTQSTVPQICHECLVPFYSGSLLTTPDPLSILSLGDFNLILTFTHFD